MTDNKFMISDASYSEVSRCAGLGVIDLHTNKKYSESVCNIDSTYTAEYRALLLSVQIAIKNKYDNVVFVYDNKALKLETLKLWLVDKIQSYQFLWLKRSYVREADKIAKKARLLHEKLMIKNSCSSRIDGNALITAFKSYSQHKIIRAFMAISNKEQFEVLKGYRDNKKYSTVFISEGGLDFYCDIFYLLSKEKNKSSFYNYIDRHYPYVINTSLFTNPKPKKYYIDLIKKIISRLGKLNTKRVKNSSVEINKKITIEKINIKPKLEGAVLIEEIRKKPVLRIVELCSVLGSQEDKKLLISHFKSKKAELHSSMNMDSINLFMLIYTLLQKKQKNNFYRFIKKRIEVKNLEKKFVKNNNMEFTIAMIGKVINKKSMVSQNATAKKKKVKEP